jgi:archaellum biogenesis protein FlaJ (TadC family)
MVNKRLIAMRKKRNFRIFIGILMALTFAMVLVLPVAIMGGLRGVA